MKKLIYLFVLSIAIISCNSDNETSQNTQKKIVNLGEKWEWVSTSGGIAGVSMTPVTTGKNYTLILKEKYSYVLLENGIETVSGTYSLTKKESIYNHEIEDWITFENPIFPISSGIINIDKSKTTMNISDNFYDGFGSTFEKVE